MKRKALVTGAAVAALAMLLAGCGGSQTTGSSSSSSTEQPADGILTSSWKGTLPKPDPAKVYNNPQDRDNVKDGGSLTVSTTYTSNWNSFNVDGNTLYMGGFWNLYMPQLWNTTSDGEVTPNKDYLDSVKVTSTDPLVIQYNINPKAKWNDGSEIDWTAFKTTWETSNGKDSNFTPAITDGYSSISSVTQGSSAKQAVVTFSQPYFPYQSLFSSLLNPKSADAKTYTSGWVDNPHSDWGAGPFIVESATKDSAVFTRNPKWWGNKSKLDKITYKYLESSATVNAFKNGEIDAMGVGNKDDLKTVMGMDDVQLRLGYSLSTYVFVYNTKAGSLKDFAVRKAITQAFDPSTWNKVSYQGMDWNPAQPTSEIMLPFQKGYKNNLPSDAKFSVANAEKTLKDAGYEKGDDGYYAKDGKTVSVDYVYFGDSAKQKALAQAYQAMQKKVGVKVNLNNLDESKWSDTVSQGNYELMPMGWSATNPFAQTSLYQLYGSDSSSNFSFIGTSKIDKLLKVPTTIEDNTKAITATNEGEKAALEQYGTIPTDTPPSYTAVKKGLANFGPHGFARQLPEDIGWQK